MANNRNLLIPYIADVVGPFVAYAIVHWAGAPAFWALTAGGLVAGTSTVINTVRRRGLDSVGMLVLLEILASLVLLVIVQDEVKALLDHFGFQCDTRAEVDRIAELARARNILVEPPTDVGGVVGYFTTVRDPDGHLVEFTYGQPLKGL